MYVQVPQVVLNLIFTYNRTLFCSPCLEVQRLERCGRRDHHWKLRQKILLSALAFSVSVVTSSHASFIKGGYVCLNLPFLANVPVKALLVICIPCQIQFQLWLSFPDPIPTHPGSMPIFFPWWEGYMSLVPLPVHFLLILQCDQEVLS